MRRKQLNFENLCEVIRDSCMLHPEERITPETQFQRDLGITGDDGDDLLEGVEKAFGIRLSRESFDLAPNEFLFDSEGFDAFGAIWRTITRKPEPEVRSFTVGELYEAAKKEHTKLTDKAIQD